MPNTADSPLLIPADRFLSDEKQHRSNNSALRQFGNIAYLAFVPIGGVIIYTGTTAPVGWLQLNGAAINRRAYKELFSIMGIQHGAGDGSTTFNLPNQTPAFGIYIVRSGVY